MLKTLQIFKKLGLLNSYFVYSSSNKFSVVKVSPFFYRKTAFFKKVKLVTTPSKKFFVKISTLRIISKSIGTAIIILETSKGLLTHQEALKLGLSGIILFIIN